MLLSPKYRLPNGKSRQDSCIGLKIVPILCSATPNTPFSMILPCFRTAPKRHVAERPADTSPFSLHAFSGLTKAIPPPCVVSASAENRHSCPVSRRDHWQSVLRSDVKIPFRPLQECPKDSHLGSG